MKATRLGMFAVAAIFTAGVHAGTVHKTGQDQDKAERIAQLKTDIRNILAGATEKFDSDDNAAAIREQIAPMITELATLNPAPRGPDGMTALVGSWHQLWADMPVDKSGQGPLADHVYEVIFPNNVFWMVALSQKMDVKDTLFLRGEYQWTQQNINFTFTKGVVGTEWLAAGSDVNLFAMKAETGAYDDNVKEWEQGYNPIGMTVTATEVYLDDDFRVCQTVGQGQQHPSYIAVYERASLVGAWPQQQQPDPQPQPQPDPQPQPQP